MRLSLTTITTLLAKIFLGGVASFVILPAPAADLNNFSFGEEPNQYYVAADALVGTSARWHQSTGTPLTETPGTNFPLRLTLGYLIRPSLSMELSYFQLSAKKFYAPGSAFFGQTMGTTTTVLIEQKMTYSPLLVVWSWPLDTQFSGALKLGIGWMNADYDFRLNDISKGSDTTRAIKPTAGLSGKYRFNRRLSAVVGIDYLPTYTYVDDWPSDSTEYQLSSSSAYLGMKFDF